MFSAPHIFLTDPVLWRKERCDSVLHWLFWIYAWAPRWPRLRGCQNLSHVQGFGSSNANTEAKDNCGSEWLYRYHVFQYSEIPRPNIQSQTQWHRAFKTRRTENGRIEVSELKRNTFVFQPISPLSAPKVQELIQILEGLWREIFRSFELKFCQSCTREHGWTKKYVFTAARQTDAYGWCLY